MNKLELPADFQAERVVIGCAIDSPQAARFAADLEPYDFVDADHRRLWRAALRCSLPYFYDGRRTHAIAEAAGLEFEVVEELRRSAPVLYDGTRHYANRLRDATRRRRVQAEAAQIHDALGSGASLDEARAGLEHAIAVANGHSVGVLAGPEALAR